MNASTKWHQQSPKISLYCKVKTQQIIQRIPQQSDDLYEQVLGDSGKEKHSYNRKELQAELGSRMGNRCDQLLVRGGRRDKGRTVEEYVHSLLQQSLPLMSNDSNVKSLWKQTFSLDVWMLKEKSD